jgi:hypothetical protein
MKLQETLLRVDDGGGASTKEQARCTNDMKDQQLVLETRMRLCEIELHTNMKINNPLLKRYLLLLHGICSIIKCPGCLHTVHCSP